MRGDHFIPGLKPRGHEDGLGLTPAELLASLPEPAAAPAGRSIFADDDGPLDVAEGDLEVARDEVRRRGHRSLP